MRIAHVSDVHLLEARTSPASFSARLVSYARAFDPGERTAKLARALAAAVAGGADHVVVSGDLTEIGSPAQYEAFGEALANAGLPGDKVTLVPGNHDAYTAPDAWSRALAGPLAPYRATSATRGAIVVRGDVAIVPLDTSCHQSITRSGGGLSPAVLDWLAHRLKDPAMRTRAIVLVQHHPPFSHARTMLNVIDGLRGQAELERLLAAHDNVQLLHGHLHRRLDRVVGRSRVFGAPAVVDDVAGPRVRFYLADGGVLASEDAPSPLAA